MSLTDQPRRVFGRVVAAAMLVAAPLAVGACGDDEAGEQAGDAPPTMTMSPQETTPTTTTNAEEAYFASDGYVGQQVTVTAPVDVVLDDRAVVLSGEQYGDESLLVLAEPDQLNAADGDIVTVTGTVRTFNFDEYQERYGLADATMYEVYADEEFLMADKVEKVTVTPAPSTTPSG
jgi:hypothetical protein